MKNILKNKKWFTLIELLVMITIVWLLALWVTQISFKKNIDRDHLDTVTSEIYNLIERVRNDSLLWKWIWTSLKLPDWYKIELTKDSEKKWSFKSFYLSGWTYTQLDSIETEWNERIKETVCTDIDWWNRTNDLNNIEIILIWEDIKFTWCTYETNKIIRFIVRYNWYEKEIIINSVSWLMDINTVLD